MRSIVFLFITLIIGWHTNLHAQIQPEVSPDSLIAYLYSIRISKAPDSIKGVQILKVLEKFGMDTLSYRQFYQEFLTLPTQKQEAYLKKAAELIRKMAQHHRLTRGPIKAARLMPRKHQWGSNPDGNE